MLMGVTVLELTDMAGEMSFRPKLSRLLETLLMLRGAVFVLELELEVNRKETSTCRFSSTSGPRCCRRCQILVIAKV